MSALGALPVPVGRRQPTSQRQAPVCRVHQADMGLLAQHRIHELRTTVGRIEVRHQVEHGSKPAAEIFFPAHAELAAIPCTRCHQDVVLLPLVEPGIV